MEIIFITIIIFIIFSLTIQGFFILNEKHGYQQNPKVKFHPEIKHLKKGDGLMTVKFDQFNDDEFKNLYNRIQKLKMEELFSEPYDGDMEEEE